MKFTKMHGAGNDYVYVDGFAETVDDPNAVARRVADRHFGVGGDGLILVLPSAVADCRMRMFNADGSEGEMCGNGIRCVAKYAYDHGRARANPMRVETGRGILTIDLQLGGDGKVATATVDMGEPILDLPKVPVDPAHLSGPGGRPHEHRLALPGGESFDASFVSTGNPHATIYVPDVAAVDLARVGPLLERHPAFPRRVNVHFVQVHSPAEVTMRTWERGSGITLACGTGATAVCVSGVLTGRTGRTLLAHLPGGDLTLEWPEGGGSARMTGPAAEVFSGEWNG